MTDAETLQGTLQRPAEYGAFFALRSLGASPWNPVKGSGEAGKARARGEANSALSDRTRLVSLNLYTPKVNFRSNLGMARTLYSYGISFLWPMRTTWGISRRSTRGDVRATYVSVIV